MGWGWLKKGAETMADVATFGTYSAAKEGAGYGESESYIDAVNDKYNPIYDDVKKGVGVVAETAGVDANSLGFGPDPGPLKPYELGQENFKPYDDMSRDLYGQALGRAGRELAPTTIRDQRLPASAMANVAGPAGVERFEAANPGVFSGVERAQMNLDPANQIRQGQVQDVQMLRDAAQGRGPSAADAQYNVALSRLNNEVDARVNMARGEDKAAASNEAMLERSRRGMEAAAQSAALKAQEMQGARGQLVGATGDVRELDVSTAGQVAGLAQGANNLDANLRSGREEFTAGLQQDARKFGAQASNVSGLDYANRLDAITTRNADAFDRRAVNNANLGLQRDVAQDNANRGAFTATTDAQLGALDAAQGAGRLGLDTTSQQVRANAEGYDLAIREREAEAKRKAAINEGRRQLATDLLSL